VATFLLVSLCLAWAPVPGRASSLREDAVVLAVKGASPAVVNISTEETVKRKPHPFSSLDLDPFFDQFFNNFFDPRDERNYTHQSLGSGVIFKKDGFILTNWHVVEKASSIKVILINEQRYDAQLIGSSPELDLAVLKIEVKEDLPTIRLGNSDTLMMGERVIAIGNPFGLSHTVTTGVVSAVNRAMKVGDEEYRDFIQTDASINPGNSGGPLLTIDGELIGINTAIYGQGAQGIGFAIPINKAKRVVDNLILHGELSPVWLGMQVQDLSPELASYLGYEGTGGVLVKKLEPGSPAEKAGMEKTDIITRIENKDVKDASDYWASLKQYTPKDTIPFTVFRKGKSIAIPLSAEEFPVSKAEEYVYNLLGIGIEEIAQKAKGGSGKTDHKGVLVSKIKPQSRAERVGIKPGDMILQINKTTINSLQDFRKAVASIFQNEDVLLLVQRGAYGYYLTLPIGS
jgi:Do/DeqQ family serine protease